MLLGPERDLLERADEGAPQSVKASERYAALFDAPPKARRPFSEVSITR
jgi:hypothetical protein